MKESANVSEFVRWVMGCFDDTINILRTETGRLGDYLERRVLPQSLIASLFNKSVYDVAMGRSQNSIRYLPSRPLKTASDFTPMFDGVTTTLCDPADGPCTLTPRQLGATSETVTWDPKWAWWKGPKFCHNSMSTAHKLAQQLSDVFSVISANVTEDINRELYFDLVDLAENTLIPTGDEGGAITVNIFENYDAADTCPTCPLTLGTIQTAIQHGWRRGSFGNNNNGGLFGMRNGRPNALLICGAECAANVVQYDIRARSQDGYRGTYDIGSLFAPAGSNFLNRFGIRSYCDVNFFEIPYPRRGTCADGTFTPVADSITNPDVGPDCESAAPNRVATVINPDWEDFTTAPIEEAILLLRNDIFEIQSWPVIRSPGGGLQFRDATNFMGQWELVDWRDCVENPLGLNSYPQAVHAYAAKPQATYAAYKIYFSRCPISGECGPCS